MGVSLSWFAAKKDVPKSVLYELEERLWSRRKELHMQMGSMGKKEGSIVLEQKAVRGWHFVIVERDDVIEAASDVLINLSVGADVVACFVEEHVMVSRAASWKDAKLLWSADYEADGDKGKFKTAGTMPPAFKSIYAEASAVHGGPDEMGDYMFDVPVKLAQSITGYRYDMPLQ